MKRKCVISVSTVGLLLVAGFLGVSFTHNDKLQFIGVASAAGGSFGGGDGTLGNPYVIEDVFDLQNMSTNLDAHYILANDIDASSTVTWNSGKGFEPIANDTYTGDWYHQGPKFNGSVDGNGFNITGLVINRPSSSYLGLIGCIGENGKVNTVSLIDNHVIGENYLGGLAGYNSGSIRNCTSTGEINGTGHSIGGIVGLNNGIIEKSYATGEVSGTGGWNSFAIGGLIGYNFGTVSECYSTGNARGTGFTVTVGIGGLIGANENSIVEHCYATGNVSGDWYVGGLMGFRLGDTVINSFYCINATKVNNRHYVTPFGIYKNQYKDWWDNNKVLNIDDYLCKIPMTDYYEIAGIIDMKNMLPFSASGDYNFRQTEDIDLSSDPYFYIPTFINGEYDGNGYSVSNLDITYYLNEYMGLFGHAENASIINVSIIDHDVSGVDYIGGLVGHINDGKVENCYATGNVTGNDDVGGLMGNINNGEVVNCYATCITSGCDYVGGLVGSNGASITNCYVTGTTIGEDHVGGLVGINGASITNCYATGTTSGEDNIGGLVGSNGDSIKNCYATGIVSGDDYIGGFVGENSKTITNCYATGPVTGNIFVVGGLVGINYGSGGISDCYATGPVTGNNYIGGLVGWNDGSVSRCFWNTQTSGQASSDGGFGRTTAQMKTRTIFTNTGWDFNVVWSNIEGESYPFLRCLDYQIEIIASNINLTYEDELYSADYDATSLLPGISTFVYWNVTSNSKDWFSIDENGVLQGTPFNNNVGVCWINITASVEDNSFAFTNFSLEIININDPPEITTDTNDITSTLYEDSFYNLSLEAIDIDPTNDSLLWSLETDASFLELNSTTGELSGTPNNMDVGNWELYITVSDGKGGNDSIDFSLSVVNTNDPPDIYITPTMHVREDELYSVVFEASDIDPTNDILTWYLNTNASFLSIDPETGNLSGTPTNSDVGTWWVNITVEDGNDGNDSINYTLEITNTNDAPEIITAPSETAYEDLLYFTDFKALDIDPVPDRLTWTLETDASFLDIDTSTGNLSGTPSNSDVGTWWVNVSVNDENGGFDFVNYTLTVINTNDAPEINSTPSNVVFNEDTTYWGIALNDWFGDMDGDELFFRHSPHENITIKVHSNSTVSLTPRQDWSGSEEIWFYANDSKLEISDSIRVTVSPVNDAPTDPAIELVEKTYREGKRQLIRGNATDVDIPYGDNLTFRWYISEIDKTLIGQEVDLSLPSGRYTIVLNVSDSHGLSIEDEVTISVRKTDDTASSEEGGFGGLAYYGLLGFAVIIILLVIVVVVFLIVRKRRRTSSKEEPHPDDMADRKEIIEGEPGGKMVESNDEEAVEGQSSIHPVEGSETPGVHGNTVEITKEEAITSQESIQYLTIQKTEIKTLPSLPGEKSDL